jgi:hypothetical protein
MSLDKIQQAVNEHHRKFCTKPKYLYLSKKECEELPRELISQISYFTPDYSPIGMRFRSGDILCNLIIKEIEEGYIKL